MIIIHYPDVITDRNIIEANIILHCSPDAHPGSMMAAEKISHKK